MKMKIYIFLSSKIFLLFFCVLDSWLCRLFLHYCFCTWSFVKGIYKKESFLFWKKKMIDIQISITIFSIINLYGENDQFDNLLNYKSLMESLFQSSKAHMWNEWKFWERFQRPRTWCWHCGQVSFTTFPQWYPSILTTRYRGVCIS